MIAPWGRERMKSNVFRASLCSLVMGEFSELLNWSEMIMKEKYGVHLRDGCHHLVDSYFDLKSESKHPRVGLFRLPQNLFLLSINVVLYPSICNKCLLNVSHRPSAVLSAEGIAVRSFTCSFH